MNVRLAADLRGRRRPSRGAHAHIYYVCMYEVGFLGSGARGESVSAVGPLRVQYIAHEPRRDHRDERLDARLRFEPRMLQFEQLFDVVDRRGAFFGPGLD